MKIIKNEWKETTFTKVIYEGMEYYRNEVKTLDEITYRHNITWHIANRYVQLEYYNEVEGWRTFSTESIEIPQREVIFQKNRPIKNQLRHKLT